MVKLPLLFPRFAKAAAAVLIAGGLAASVHADPRASRYYEDALQRYAQKDYGGAIIQLKNALLVDSRQLPVQLLLGKALQANGELVAAEVAFEEALRLGVSRSEVVVPLARVVAALGRPQAVLGESRFAPAGLPRGLQAELLVVKASAHADLGQTREALAMLEEARSLGAAGDEVWRTEVSIRIRGRQFAEALQAADRAITVAPASAESHYLRGSVHHAAGRLDLALKSYTDAVARQGDHLEALLARAGLYLDRGERDAAGRDVQAARVAAPRDPRGSYLAALLAERDGDPRTARAMLGEVTALLDPVPTESLRYRPQLLILGGLSHYGLQQMEKAKPYLEQLQRQQAGNPAVKLLARIHLRDGNPDRATEVLEAYVRAVPTDGQAQVLLANAHLSQGRHARAGQILQDAIRHDDSPQLQAALGLSLMRGGRDADALKALEAAYKADPAQTRAGIALVTLYVRQGQLKQAAALAEGLVKRQPTQAALHNVLGTVRAEMGEPQRAAAAFGRALELEPAHDAAQLNLARLDIAAGELSRAQAGVERVLARNDKHVEALVEMGLLAERQGRGAEATRWLQKAADHAGAGVLRPAVVLVMHHLSAGRVPAAQEAVRQLTQKAPDHLTVLMANARVALAAADLANARVYLTRASRTAEFDANAQVQVALLQLRAGDAKGAHYSLTKALQAEPGHVPAMMLLVDAELALGEPARAETLARDLLGRQPRAAMPHRLIGDIERARGDLAKAVASYRRAQELEPSTDNLLRLFGALALQDGPASIRLAQQWLAARPDDIAVRRALADGHARAGQMAAARQQYEAVIQRRADDAEALNNYAHVLLALGDPGALKAAERALALQPERAHVVGTAGWAAFKAGQPDRALQLLRDASLRDPQNGETRYYLASVLASLGRTAEARRELEAALQSGQRLASERDARALMARLP